MIFTLIDFGIYHGDGHLKNFMFTREGYGVKNIKIIDFGKTRETVKRWGISVDTIAEDDYLIVMHFLTWSGIYKHHLRSIMTILKYSDIPDSEGLTVLCKFLFNNGDNTVEELDAIIRSIPPRIIEANDDAEYDDAKSYDLPNVPLKK